MQNLVRRWRLALPLLLAVALLGAACSDDDFDDAPADRGASAAEAVGAGGSADRGSDVERGRELFFANGCNICHGDTGGGGIGPTIAQTLFSVDQVIQQYRTPRAFMPAFPADLVPDADVGDIQAWLQTLSLPDNIVPGEGTP